MAWRHDDNTLGILKANLELRNMFIICSQYRDKEKEGGQRGVSLPPPPSTRNKSKKKFFPSKIEKHKIFTYE